MGKSAVLLLVLVLLTTSCITTVKPIFAVSPDSWISKAELQEARAHLGVAVVNGKVYAIGGDVGSETGNLSPGWGNTYHVVSTNEEYDPATDTWTLKTPMPTSRARFGIAVCQNKIYCIGGYTAEVTYIDGHVDTTTYSDVSVNEVYDPATDTWETKASMPTARRSANANVVNNKIYVTDEDLNEVYDPATDTWETKTPPPCELTSYASVVVDDKIYFIGARTNSSGLWTGAFFQIYDPESDTWSTGTEAPTYGSGAGLTATTGSTAPKQIIVFEETATYTYDFTADSWTNSTSMPTARLIVGVAVVDDTFYVVGGRSGQHGYITMMYPSSVNEQYTPIGYGTPDTSTPSPSPSPEAQDSEPFPTALVATVSGASIAIISIVLLVYFRKRKHFAESDLVKNS